MAMVQAKPSDSVGQGRGASWLGVLVLVSLPVLSCATDRECERARLDTHRAYHELSTEVVQRKQAGVDPAAWAALENKAATLESSFATPQVTWRSAEKARNEVEAALGQLSTDRAINLSIFKQSADLAFKTQDAFAARCR